ncbi:IS110 family transposase [Arthrobacter sp. TB 23]|uniref:IS110 family transposase n=1 Tax=Arthrobacter sp. TB 23 TaxID=494419 RepID=UPI0002EABBBE|nr:transposase [Arthrobacter sp. TB 23]
MFVEQESIDVYLGLDVGKTGHHAVAMNLARKKLKDRALPQGETRIWEVLSGLPDHGRVMVIVYQHATIGVLPVAVARSAGAEVGCSPGLTMHRCADLHPGQAKTDARDAAISAEAARTMPHTLRSVDLDDEALAELGVLFGFVDDLVSQITALRCPLRHAAR